MTGAARHHPRRQAFRRCNAYGASWLRPPCCGEQKLRRRIVEADLGPVRYLVALIGASDEPVLRYFILAEALLVRGGPDAVTLGVRLRNHSDPIGLR